MKTLAIKEVEKILDDVESYYEFDNVTVGQVISEIYSRLTDLELAQ